MSSVHSSTQSSTLNLTKALTDLTQKEVYMASSYVVKVLLFAIFAFWMIILVMQALQYQDLAGLYDDQVNLSRTAS